jgi:hypothetical protein
MARLVLAALILSTLAHAEDGGARDAGLQDQWPRAADGTPMVLPDGDANPAYYSPPKGYRSPEGFQKTRWGMTLDKMSADAEKAAADDP